MADGYVPTVKYIVETLTNSPEEKHQQNKDKFTEENVRKAIIALKIDDSKGNYKYSEQGLLISGHLGQIADKIIETKSGGASSESKTKRKRRRGKGKGKGKSRRNRK